jgi:hypothetical protein
MSTGFTNYTDCGLLVLNSRFPGRGFEPSASQVYVRRFTTWGNLLCNIIDMEHYFWFLQICFVYLGWTAEGS